MPKRVDHDQRRRQIADALLRIVASRGLRAAGMREVAAEAGVSVRLIQYYFGSKEELLLFAIRHLAGLLAERVKARVKAAGAPADPRTVIAAILTEGLPSDDESRVFNVVYMSYFAMSLTDPALDARPLVESSDAVIGVVAAQLRAAQQAGQMPPDLDAQVEAVSLMALSAGLGTSVLGGQTAVDEALAIIGYHLDRLLGPSGEG
jgi:AcrR family transcriptional regulator